MDFGIAAIPSNLLLSLCCGLLLAVASHLVYRCFFSPLSNVPGPLAATFGRWWLLLHVLRGDLSAVTPELHKKYGKLNRQPLRKVFQGC
jgi:hypothetical protein